MILILIKLRDYQMECRQFINTSTKRSDLNKIITNKSNKEKLINFKNNK